MSYEAIRNLSHRIKREERILDQRSVLLNRIGQGSVNQGVDLSHASDSLKIIHTKHRVQNSIEIYKQKIEENKKTLAEQTLEDLGTFVLSGEFSPDLYTQYKKEFRQTYGNSVNPQAEEAKKENISEENEVSSPSVRKNKRGEVLARGLEALSSGEFITGDEFDLKVWNQTNKKIVARRRFLLSSIKRRLEGTDRRLEVDFDPIGKQGRLKAKYRIVKEINTQNPSSAVEATVTKPVIADSSKHNNGRGSVVPDAEKKKPELTENEIKMLNIMSTGATEHEIKEYHNIPLDLQRLLKSGIYQVFGTNNQAEAVLIGIDKRILDLEKLGIAFKIKSFVDLPPSDKDLFNYLTDRANITKGTHILASELELTHQEIMSAISILCSRLGFKSRVQMVVYREWLSKHLPNTPAHLTPDPRII